MALLYTPLPYCTLTNIQDRLSVNGVNLRIDDVPPDTLGDVIAEASTIVDEHLATRYDPIYLQQSGWVLYRATDIATFLLCERRGNPAPMSVGQRYERAMAAMERVRTGNANVWDTVERKTCAPTMTNVRVVLRPFPRSVCETGTLRSTGTVTDYARNRDPAELIVGANQGVDLIWCMSLIPFLVSLLTIPIFFA